MTVSTYLTCDAVMDEYGSTCAARAIYSSTRMDVVQRKAREDRWLIGSDGGALCPRHSGVPVPLGRLRVVADGGDRG